jgi:acyl-CoA reductase-like NAD-dependent aldehyde dehydrogenase
MANSTDISFDSFWNILDGERRGSSRVHHGTNPATGKPLWDAPIATGEDVDEAVRAAQKAFPKWSATEYSSRVQLLNQFADAFLKLAPEFTKLLQAETGRTVS